MAKQQPALHEAEMSKLPRQTVENEKWSSEEKYYLRPENPPDHHVSGADPDDAPFV